MFGEAWLALCRLMGVSSCRFPVGAAMTREGHCFDIPFHSIHFFFFFKTLVVTVKRFTLALSQLHLASRIYSYLLASSSSSTFDCMIL